MEGEKDLTPLLFFIHGRLKSWQEAEGKQLAGEDTGSLEMGKRGQESIYFTLGGVVQVTDMNIPSMEEAVSSEAGRPSISRIIFLIHVLDHNPQSVREDRTVSSVSANILK